MNDPMNVIWPKVTVIIVNWNGERFLDRCLSALLAQTVAPHEILLVDNASSDGSLDLVRRFPSVRLLAQDRNLGFARGNNLAIEEASAESEWIALLNPDAFVEPRWLEALLLATRDYPAFEIFGSKLVAAADPAILDGAGDAYHVSGLVWRRGHGAPVTSVSEQVREAFSPCAAAALYRRSALVEAGGFDEDFFCYLEDLDLGFRLRLAGYRCLYVSASVAHHVGSGTTSGQHSDFAVYHGHRNLVWTYVKNMPWILFWAFLPLHLAMNLVALLVFSWRGQGLTMLRAKRDALKGIPDMWRKRRSLQSTRIATVREIWRLMDKSIIPTKRGSMACDLSMICWQRSGKRNTADPGG
ncbi:glycosyltransferase family 2 protein [Candidatus Accumulibacter vicinus]|uniref:glycosyltransferase family 2 protein n=1 Tax=Candidatus Accumulibacter vicinus TaxID=2954382 RepID=UPI0030811940